MAAATPPTIPTDPAVIELSDLHAPRTCKVCGDPADWYVFVTDEIVFERTGVEIGHDEWPVNAFLCTAHFRDAPRVESVEALVDAESA